MQAHHLRPFMSAEAAARRGKASAPIETMAGKLARATIVSKPAGGGRELKVGVPARRGTRENSPTVGGDAHDAFSLSGMRDGA
jgi:hypothetical protein